MKGSARWVGGWVGGWVFWGGWGRYVRQKDGRSGSGHQLTLAEVWRCGCFLGTWGRSACMLLTGLLRANMLLKGRWVVCRSGAGQIHLVVLLAHLCQYCACEATPSGASRAIKGVAVLLRPRYRRSWRRRRRSWTGWCRLCRWPCRRWRAPAQWHHPGRYHRSTGLRAALCSVHRDGEGCTWVGGGGRMGGGRDGAQ